jgi:hypothetical protein
METQRITRKQFEDRLAELCVESGSMEFPRRTNDRHILWKSIVLGLDTARKYTEKEIDGKIKQWLQKVGRAVSRDHVNLRRQLVDEGYLTRTLDGSEYHLALSGPNQDLFELDVEDVNTEEVVQKRTAAVVQKRHDFLKRRLTQST